MSDIVNNYSETLRSKLLGHISGANNNRQGYIADAIAYAEWLCIRDRGGRPNSQGAEIHWTDDGRWINAVTFGELQIKIPNFDWRPVVEFTIQLPNSTFTASIHCPAMFSKLLTKVWKVQRAKKARKAKEQGPILSAANDPDPGPLLTHKRIKAPQFKLRLVVNNAA